MDDGRVRWGLGISLVAAIGCGPSAGADGGGSDGTQSSGEQPTDSGVATATDTGGTEAATGSGTADSTADATGPGETDTGDTSGGASSSGGDESSTGTPVNCEPPDAVAALPNIWVANAGEGTVSKINTQSAVEEGRYLTRQDGAGNPSRTSVAFDGDVVIANRNGGVTKIFANSDDCADTNGMVGLQTSTDSTPMAWDVEECRAWHTPLTYSSNRPIAWTPGTLNEESCAYEGAMIWTAGASGANTAEVLLLDGETGAVMQTIPVPEVTSGIGLYGGAVDAGGNFWALSTSEVLVRVDFGDQSIQSWPIAGMPAYGITVDAQGRPFICGGGGIARFDAVGGTFDLSAGAGPGIGGCFTDGQGTLWLGRYPDSTLVGFDTDSLGIVAEIPVPEYLHGVGVDFDGMVWGVPIAGSAAYRIDPSSGAVTTVPNLVGVYTYSDMTGLSLASVSGLL